MRSLRMIVAGSRGFRDRLFVYNKLNHLTRHLDEVVVLSGMCEDSPDEYSVEWADYRGWPWEPYPAAWDDLAAPGAVIGYGKDRKPYNKLAGFQRNEIMASKAEALVLFQHNGSRGSADMLRRAQAHNLLIRHFVV